MEEVVEEQKEEKQKSGSSSKERSNNKKQQQSRPKQIYNNNLEKWHYSKCSEIKIHFYVRNIYIGDQNENDFLFFVKERVQKAGQCELLQICHKNREEQSIDIAIGMRYDLDAKLIYIGKKHINLASKYNMHANNKISPVISNIFEIMLRESGELDKQTLEKELRRQRFGDSQQRRRRDSSSSSSRSRSRQKRSMNKNKIEPQKLQNYQPVTLVRKKAEIKQLDYKPVTFTKESIYIFCIPLETTLQECMDAIVQCYNIESQLEGEFRQEKIQSNQIEQIFEYLEIKVDDINLFKQNITLKIKNVPCLLCFKRSDQTFSDVISKHQLIIQCQTKISSQTIYNEFKNYGDIVSLYSAKYMIQSEEYILIYSTQEFSTKLKPPGEKEIFIDTNTKAQCQYYYLEYAAVQFNRLPFNQTLYYQSQSLLKQQIQQQNAIDMRSDSSSSSNHSSDSSSSSSNSSRRNNRKPNKGSQRFNQRRDQNRRNYNNKNRQNFHRNNKFDGNTNSNQIQIDRHRGNRQFQQRRRYQIDK